MLALILLFLNAGCDEPVGELPPVPAGNEEQALVHALQQLHEAAANPEDGDARGQLAMAYDVNGFPELAIVVYGQAAELAADNFNWPYFRALLFAQTHSNYAGALEALDAALAIDDSYVPAWLSRGGWLRELDQPEASREAYDKAVQLGAGAPAIVGIANLYMDEGRFEEAVAVLEPLNGETPDPRIERLLGRAYRALGRDADARIATARGNAATSSMQWVDPKLGQRASFIAGFSNRLLHAQNLIQAGRPTAALPLAAALVEEQPEDIAAINTLAWANAASERIDEARAVLQRGIELHPEEPRFHQMLSNAYRDEDNLPAARHHLERVLELDAGNARALEELGWLIARAGEADAGIKLLERAFEAGARDPKLVLFRLGLLDGAGERWGKAAGWFRDAARIDASYTMAYVYLGRCLAEMGHFEEARVALGWADLIGTHAEEREAAAERVATLVAAVSEHAPEGQVSGQDTP